MKTVNLPDIRERYIQTSLDVRPMTRDQFAGWIDAEIAKWKKVAQAANIALDY